MLPPRETLSVTGARFGEISDERLLNLRARFTAVARRRVPVDAVEDLVQEAMQVVLTKGSKLSADAMENGLPTLTWCFQVLRHVIGNYYRRRGVGTDRAVPIDETAPTASSAPTPVEALDQGRLAQWIENAMKKLRDTDPGCARYLDRLLAGIRPAALAVEEGLTEPVLYRRVYRCRTKLRDYLAAEGVEL